MKSPTATHYHEAPPTQLMDRSSDIEARPPTAETVARLPLRAQAVFRRRLLALLSLHVLVVGAAVAVVAFACGDGTRRWLVVHIVDDAVALVVLGVSTIALLVVLLLVRDVPPLHWAALALFSVAQTLCLITADLAVGSHIVLLNWGFAWVATTLMAAMAGWTHRTGRGDKGCGWTWLPAEYDEHDAEASSQQLWVAYATAGLAFVVTSALAALLLCENVVDSHTWTVEDLLLSCLAQLLAGFWVAYEVERLAAVTASDASAGYVLVHVYTDVVAAAVTLAMLALSCLCIATTESGSGLASIALEFGPEGCCACLEHVARPKTASVAYPLDE